MNPHPGCLTTRRDAWSLRVSLALVTLVTHWSSTGTMVAAEADPPLVIRGDLVYTMNGPPLRDGVVVIIEGKIAVVGPVADTPVPPAARMLRGKVVTPGLVDAHTVVGLTGFLNQEQDQDQLDRGEPVQPELRAIDSYNPRERLIEWVRGFGVTTIHTGHAPGALVSGQTMVVKTVGDTVEEAVVEPFAMVAATLGEDARPSADAATGKSPGTRSQAVAGILCFAVLFALIIGLRFLDGAAALQPEAFAPVRDAVEALQLFGHLEDFTNGVIDSRQVFFYLTGAVLALIFSILGVEAKLLQGDK